MDEHGWELLDQQTQRLIPPQNNGVMGLIAVVTFCAGIAFGTLFTPPKRANADRSGRYASPSSSSE